MSDKTPKRNTAPPKSTGFSPIILHESPVAASPQKNLTGLPRVARDLAADVYNNIQKWNDLHIKGSLVVKQIASVKADNPNNMNSCLQDLTSDLFGIVQKLGSYRDVLQCLHSQMRALTKLQKETVPIFISLNVSALANLVESIAVAYGKEMEMKELVLESIAHSRNKSEAMFYAALWTYQINVTEYVCRQLEVLLVETGHRKIT